MISAVHALIYSDDAPATRAFFKDVLQLPYVSDDGGSEASNWLIFNSGPSEIGVHPTQEEFEGESFNAPRHHQISLMTADISAYSQEITARGAKILSGPMDMGFGVGVEVEVPGTDAILIYQPKHATTFAS